MKIKKLLVANRGEIAIRIFRACVENKISTVGIYTYEDRYSLHRYKADEAYQIGNNNEPLKPYLDINKIIEIAKENNVDAIHPGYGFLSENSDFADACNKNNIIFVGPNVSVLKSLGNKVLAKEVAKKNNVPIITSSKKKLDNINTAIEEATTIGFPVMLKAASGGGGRGMRVIRNTAELEKSFNESRREALNAFGDDTVFIEKFIENPKHIEIQIVADNFGNIVHFYERDCSVQRRYQKVIEYAPSFNLEQNIKDKLYSYAISICKEVGYNNVGTVEFLVDQDGSIYFIEVNPRIQVEHTVTEMVTGVDLIKTQILIASDYKLDSDKIKISSQKNIKTNGFAIQCRITTEDPEDNFKPDYGTVSTYRSASGFGIRLDDGNIYQGVTISPFFDSMLVKVSASSRTLLGACDKMLRALAEFRIRGVKTNMPFLKNILNNEVFKNGEATVNFIQNTKGLFTIKESRNRASKLINFIGDNIINGNADVKNKDINKTFIEPKIPSYDKKQKHPKGTKDKLIELGPENFCKWLSKEKKIHYTDTTLRDAHQSLLATRMRSYDMFKIIEGYSKNHPEVFSIEMWGGATFDVCLRFLKENPWERLRTIRKLAPNILTQMLIRGSNGVGYKAYPDNLIQRFVEEAWINGVDIFRVFDSLNWMKSMEPCIKFVRDKTKGIAEGAICYTGDILDVKKTKYDLKYYINLAKDVENAGAHILAIKDMAGLLKPYAAYELITCLKSEINIPIHLHTHDTSSIQSASYIKAIEAGVDVIDVALGGLSCVTSQPNFNSIVEAMKNHERENKINIDKLNEYSNYWERVREYYYCFESGLKTGTAEVYKHEIPGGQYSNLKPQAISLGLESRFNEITEMYGNVNKLFGDIVKVTPSSKVVGDMAQYLVSNNLTCEDVKEKGNQISFPQSVVSFFKGDLGQPIGGFDKNLQSSILKNIKPITTRPNEHLEPINFETEWKEFKTNFSKGIGREIEFTDFLSFKLYPEVFKDAYQHHIKYDNVINIPTKVFFYGMDIGEEIEVEIQKGKSISIELVSVGKPNIEGVAILFFKVNGQTRSVKIKDNSISVDKVSNIKANKNDDKQIGAPLQGFLSNVLVTPGEKIKRNDPMFIIEAMKMETTITANEDCSIKNIHIEAGTMVDADDLIITVN